MYNEDEPLSSRQFTYVAERFLLVLTGFVLTELPWLLFYAKVSRHMVTNSIYTRQSSEMAAKTLSGVQTETSKVTDAVTRLAEETAKAQRLAIKIGVATGILGAVLGGFAGAFANRLIG